MKAFTFDDILLTPQYNDIASRKDVSISSEDLTGKLKLELPVFSANMDTITDSDMARFMRSMGGMGIIHRFMTVEENVFEYEHFKDCVVSVGVSEGEKERFHALRDAGADRFCVDVAHGHSKAVGDMVKYIKDNTKDTLIIAGNVCTWEGANYLAESGADIIKVGIGPSPVCRTRGATGHGFPQLSAIENCSGVDRSIIADGGIKSPGDIVKALAFGADFVMIGSMLAGTHFTPGQNPDWRCGYYGDFDGPLTKNFRGMASREANEEFFGSLPEWKTAEGVSISVPYKDEVQTLEIIQDITGGLRSGLTYSGARNIKELQTNKNYVTVTNSTIKENKTYKD